VGATFWPQYDDNDDNKTVMMMMMIGKVQIYSNDGADLLCLTATSTNLNCISPYRAVNTMRLGYNRQAMYV